MAHQQSPESYVSARLRPPLPLQKMHNPVPPHDSHGTIHIPSNVE